MRNIFCWICYSIHIV